MHPSATGRSHTTLRVHSARPSPRQPPTHSRARHSLRLTHSRTRHSLRHRLLAPLRRLPPAILGPLARPGSLSTTDRTGPTRLAPLPDRDVGLLGPPASAQTRPPQCLLGGEHGPREACPPPEVTAAFHARIGARRSREAPLPPPNPRRAPHATAPRPPGFQGLHDRSDPRTWAARRGPPAPRHAA